MERRAFLTVLTAISIGSTFGLAPLLAAEIERDDLAAPRGGNPQGDVLVVAFFDYNCPYCRRAEPELRRFVESDGHVRLVYEDWPVLTDASVVGARLALAAAYQGAYETAHRALMSAPGRRSSAQEMRTLLTSAGIDAARLDADATAHAKDIAAQLARNDAHARRLGLTAVPAILVGDRQVVGGFDAENFAEFAARARSAAVVR